MGRQVINFWSQRGGWAPVLISLLVPFSASADPGFYPGTPIHHEALRYRTSRKVARKLQGDFAHALPSCPTETDCTDGFRVHQAIHDVPGPIDRVFEAFLHQDFRLTWSGATRIDLLYDPNAHGAFSRESLSYPALEVGQIFVVRLRLMGILRIPVAFEVTNIDREDRSVTFSYLEQNVSQGIQIIRFSEDGEAVRITHSTRFRSDSPVRDRYFYARWHERYLNGFYRRFAKELSPLADQGLEDQPEARDNTISIPDSDF